MNSTDLPVTEWWDPEWDVYDVPGSPYDNLPVGAALEPAHPSFDVWWAAYEHLWMLELVIHGTAAYVPFHFQHQLTTGRPS